MGRFCKKNMKFIKKKKKKQGTNYDIVSEISNSMNFCQDTLQKNRAEMLNIYPIFLKPFPLFSFSLSASLAQECNSYGESGGLATGHPTHCDMQVPLNRQSTCILETNMKTRVSSVSIYV